MGAVLGVLAAALALASCGDSVPKAGGVPAAPADVDDPRGDCCINGAPAQLDLLRVSVEVRGQLVVFEWQVAAPFDEFQPQLGANYSWAVILRDEREDRTIVANYFGPEPRAWVAFHDSRFLYEDLPKLPLPTFSGDTVRIEAPLADLKWDGTGGTWFAEAGWSPAGGDPLTVDKTPKNELGGAATERAAPASRRALT